MSDDSYFSVRLDVILLRCVAERLSKATDKELETMANEVADLVATAQAKLDEYQGKVENGLSTLRSKVAELQAVIDAFPPATDPAVIEALTNFNQDLVGTMEAQFPTPPPVDPPVAE